MIFSAFQGFCMALADSVPGVSGGTIAFILGFYEEFLTALHDLFGRERGKRWGAFCYLAKIGVGWCAGMILSILVISQALNDNLYFLSSLFLGLTVASIPLILVSEWGTLRTKTGAWFFVLLGILLVYGTTAVRQVLDLGGTIRMLELTPMEMLQLFVSGALAISAMALPGISGSTLMLILGVYVPVVHALEQVFRFHLVYLPGLICFGLGVLCGIALSVRYIRLLLRKHRPQMMYFILGLMLGSLYAIVMGPTTLETPQPPLEAASFQWGGFVIGIAVLLCLEFLRRTIHKRRLQKRLYTSTD